MDAPAHQSFAELVRKASNRRAWKAHVEKKFGRIRKKKLKKNNQDKKTRLPNQRTHNKVGKWVGAGSEAVWVGSAPVPKNTNPPTLSPRAPTFSPTTLTEPPPSLAKTGQKQVAKKVQSLLPLAWRQSAGMSKDRNPTTKSKIITSQQPKGKKKSKPASLNDAQRAAWAHAHYIIHHGTNHDAARLLTHQKIARNIPAAALGRIRKMAARRVPTWTHANMAVFSSSDDSDIGSEPPTNIDTSLPATATAPLYIQLCRLVTRDHCAQRSGFAESLNLGTSNKEDF